MSKMVERVGEAIAKIYAPAMDPRRPFAKVMMREAAWAAIAAMREPTPPMIDAAFGGESHSLGSRALAIYQLMIDAALDQPPRSTPT
jgi:hypothetical protein